MSAMRVVFHDSDNRNRRPVISKRPASLFKSSTMKSLLTSLINGRIDRDSRDMKEDIAGFIFVLLDKLENVSCLLAKKKWLKMAWAFLGESSGSLINPLVSWICCNSNNKYSFIAWVPSCLQCCENFKDFNHIWCRSVLSRVQNVRA